jgi:hypothetical protein
MISHTHHSSSSFKRHLPTVAAAIALGGLILALRKPPARLAFRPVRDAGPENMENPPADWDRVDEGSDQSFPASDPPVHCMRSPKKP